MLWASIRRFIIDSNISSNLPSTVMTLAYNIIKLSYKLYCEARKSALSRISMELKCRTIFIYDGLQAALVVKDILLYALNIFNVRIQLVTYDNSISQYQICLLAISSVISALAIIAINVFTNMSFLIAAGSLG